MIFHFFKSALAPGMTAATLNSPSLIERILAFSNAIATFCVVSIALGAGLAAAYGRELQAGRSPERSWWIARLLLLPLLAIGATAATEAFNLSRSTTAFTAAMLSLGGYDCLRMLEAHWRARLTNLAQATAAEPTVVDSNTRDDGTRHG